MFDLRCFQDGVDRHEYRTGARGAEYRHDGFYLFWQVHRDTSVVLDAERSESLSTAADRVVQVAITNAGLPHLKGRCVRGSPGAGGEKIGNEKSHSSV